MIPLLRLEHLVLRVHPRVDLVRLDEAHDVALKLIYGQAERLGHALELDGSEGFEVEDHCAGADEVR